MPKIPEANLRFDVYEDQAFLGVAEVRLPKISPSTVTVSGSGIMGEYEAVLLGQIAAMDMQLTFRANTSDTSTLTAPRQHNLQFWVSVQQADGTTRERSMVGVRYAVQCIPKEIDEGTLKSGSTQDGTGLYAVSRYEKWVDGEQITCIDQLTSQYIWEGKDYFAEVRQSLGLS